MYNNPATVDDILALRDVPVVAASQEGIITSINQPFTAAYGWTEDDVVGKSLTVIMPAKLRNAHQFGFSRFITTGQPRIAGKVLPLEIEYKDGTVKPAEHYILADKQSDGRWRFAATIRERAT